MTGASESANQPSVEVVTLTATERIPPLVNASVTAGANLLTASPAPVTTTTTFRIFVAFSAAGVLSAVLTVPGVPSPLVLALNANNNLSANALYAFDIRMEKGWTFNLRYSAAGTALLVDVCEVNAASS